MKVNQSGNLFFYLKEYLQSRQGRVGVNRNAVLSLFLGSKEHMLNKSPYSANSTYSCLLAVMLQSIC